MGWGPLPWVYVSDIFPTCTRHYGLALASASQWLFSKSQILLVPSNLLTKARTDFVVSKVTPTMITNLGYKIFLMFGAINVLAMGAFSLYVICWLGDFNFQSSDLRNPSALFPKPRAAVWKIWTSSSVPSRRRNVKLTSLNKNMVGLLFALSHVTLSYLLCLAFQTTRSMIPRLVALITLRRFKSCLMGFRVCRLISDAT